ncbi:MAG: hypothetical protein ACREVN_05280 [Gammaproteobacteria bacterium]
MSPLAFVTGILLGCVASIALGLLVVTFIFLLLAGDHPRLEAELRPLAVSLALFVTMTVVCGVSFIGLIRARRWRWHAQAAMWAGLLLVGYYYWP